MQLNLEVRNKTKLNIIWQILCPRQPWMSLTQTWEKLSQQF